MTFQTAAFLKPPTVLRFITIITHLPHSLVKSLQVRKEAQIGQWWHTPLIPALGRQRQLDLCEFKASLVFRASSRTGSKATEKTCLKTTATTTMFIHSKSSDKIHAIKYNYFGVITS